MNKIIDLVNQYKRIELKGVFEYGFIMHNEKYVTSKHRLIRISKVFDRYNFYIAGNTFNNLTEQQLIEEFNAMITKQVKHIKSI